MKILIVTNYLPPKIGGIERISHELASALNEIEGAEVCVATANWPAKYVEADWEEIHYPYEVISFPSITIFRRLPLPRIFQRHFWSKIQNLDRDFDLVFFQSHLFILNWIIAMKLHKVQRRVWMNQGCNYVPLSSKVGSFISFVYERVGMSIMKRFCNEYIGQSRNTADWISSKVGIPFQVLSNATNLRSISGKTILTQRQNKSKVLFVGRLVEGKGLIECISAVSKANDILSKGNNPELFTLTIVGAGPMIDQIRLEDFNINIDFKGELSHSQVVKTMYESDILIQAYTQPEGLTTVTLEGMATGMLIVSTPLSGGEQLRGCINYISGNIDQLPILLIGASHFLQTRNELLATGRNFIEAGLTWETIAQRLIDRNYSNV
jgi:glycosyltransferase involved in cell wall biosynthesis